MEEELVVAREAKTLPLGVIERLKDKGLRDKMRITRWRESGAEYINDGLTAVRILRMPDGKAILGRRAIKAYLRRRHLAHKLEEVRDQMIAEVEELGGRPVEGRESLDECFSIPKFSRKLPK